MATRADARRIALALPGAVEATDDFAFSVADRKRKQRGFAWSWKERLAPKKPRVPNKDVLAVRVDGADTKEALLAVDPAKIFTEPHYNGFPAVLVRLSAVTVAELRQLLTEAHRCMAPAESKSVPKSKSKSKPASRRRD